MAFQLPDPEDFYMDADDIKRLRTRNHLTQKQFADRLKVEAITVSRWERGARRPSLRCMQRLHRLAAKIGTA